MAALLHYTKAEEETFYIIHKLWYDAGLKRNFEGYELAEQFREDMTEALT